MELAITKQQHEIYQELSSEVARAKDRLNLCVSMILAGHGVSETKVNLEQVTPEKIVYSVPEAPK